MFKCSPREQQTPPVKSNPPGKIGSGERDPRWGKTQGGLRGVIGEVSKEAFQTVSWMSHRAVSVLSVVYLGARPGQSVPPGKCSGGGMLGGVPASEIQPEDYGTGLSSTHDSV